MKKRMKAWTLLLLSLLLCFVWSGCANASSLQKIEPAELTEEALEAFSKLDGERGILLYGDASQMTNRRIRMYAVLYGPSGQELSLAHNMRNLRMNISGEAGKGYSVWRIEYNPILVQQAAFYQNGEQCRMDAYEELSFTVETALLPAEE
ncbi:hypothetical protein LJC07_00230 [Christensenellaceae bacterium OttesenSCG-928-L17]|nr:hypothetical protein [Christensenellaceae bacterium OttesenSCG-928-L17]